MSADLHARDCWLCHYTSAEAAFEHILPSGRIRLSPYRAMRDPLENKDIRLNLTFGGRGDTASEELYGRVVNFFAAIRDDMRILSFTTDADNEEPPFSCAWARPRMWEQYGQDHRGVCLVFDREAVVRTLREQVQDQGLGISYAGQVEYTTQGFAAAGARHLSAEYFAEGDVAERVSRYIEEHHRELFFLKTDDWRTEFEYRIAVLGPPEPELYLRFGESLRSAIVSENFPAWQLPGARELTSKASATLHRLNWEMGKPILLSDGSGRRVGGHG